MPRRAAPSRRTARGAAALALAFATGVVGTTAFAQDAPDSADDDSGWEIGDGSVAPGELSRDGDDEGSSPSAVEGDAPRESPSAPPAPSAPAEPIILVPVPGMAPPPGFVEDKYSNEKLLVGGILSTLGGQVGSIALSAALVMESNAPGEIMALGFLPIAGPFALTAYEPVETFARPLYALLGLAQATGLALDVAAGFSPQRLWKAAPGQPIPVTVKAGPTAVSVSASF